MRRYCNRLQLVLIAAVAFSSLRTLAYQDGDFVSIARRGQFQEVRTQWHDLLGRHCPHFGIDRVVAVPLPQPQGFKAVDTYKISFSVAGDRLYTSWLKLKGKNAPAVPMVAATLTRIGNDIKSISAQVEDVPEHYLEQHAGLVEEWSNSTHWPKHLIIEYSWETAHEVNAIPGMYVLFATALVAGLVLAVSTLARHQEQLLELVDEVVGDDTTGHGSFMPDPLGTPMHKPPMVGPKGD